MDEKEKFADAGSFFGDGVPAGEGKAGAGSGEEAGEAGENPAAEAEEAGQAGADADLHKAEDGDSSAEKAEPEEAAKPDPGDEPISDWSKVDLGLGDAPVDKAVMEAYGKMCVDLRLSPNQAAKLAQFQLQAVNDARNRLTNEAVSSLQKEWGDKADANQQRVINLVRQVDARLGGDAFTAALNESGASCYAEIAKGLLAIADMLGEDRLGGVSDSAGASQTESALDGLKAVFATARK